MSEEVLSGQNAAGGYIAQAEQGSSASVTVKQTVYQFVQPRPVDSTLLTKAQDKLASMPLESIPEISLLPEGSQIPFNPNSLFVGRKNDLKALASNLQVNKSTVSEKVETAVISGPGGIGKTQLASEFVHRYGQYFLGGVFWLSFANQQAIPAEIAECGTTIGLEMRLDFNSLTLDDQVRLVLSAWQSSLPRLLVFDNCENEMLLNKWRPRTGSCRVIVTSRQSDWSLELGIKRVSLEILKREESIELLTKYRPNLITVNLEPIAHELGDLPLAIHMAGSFLHTYRNSTLGEPQNYLKQLRHMTPLQHPSLQEEGLTYSTGHIQDVGKTFALSYDQLDKTNPIDKIALDLLSSTIYFAPGELIPRDLLKMTLGSNNIGMAEELRIENALGRLVSLGLIENQKNNTLYLHRLLVQFLQTRLELVGTEVKANVEKAIFETALKAKQCRLSNGNARATTSLTFHYQCLTTT